MDGERFGRFCLVLGVCVLGLGMAVSLPVMHAGFWLAFCGGLLLIVRLVLAGGTETLAHPLARPAGYGAPGMWFLLGAGLWQTVAAVMGGDDWGDWAPEGSQYAWLAMPLAAAALRDAGRRRWFGRCLVLGVAAGGLLALLQFAIGFNHALRPLRIDTQAPRGERVSGCFGHHLTQAFVMGTALVAFLQHRRHLALSPIAAWTGRVGAGLGLLLTQSRSVLLAVAAGAATAASARGRRRVWIAGGGIAALALVAGLVIALAQPALLRDLARHQEARLTIWRAALAQIGERPVWGSGGKRGFRVAYLGWLREHRPDLYDPARTFDPERPEAARRAYPEVFTDERMREHLAASRELCAARPELRPRQAAISRELFDHLSGRAAFFPDRGAPHAHSSLLTLAAFYGLPCALLHLAGLVVVAVHLLRRRRAAPRSCALGLGLLACYLVAGVFEHVAGDSESAYAFWTLVGLALVLETAGPEREGGY